MSKITRVVIGLALALGATSALGQSNPRYVQFRPSATKGALYSPDSGPAPTVAFLAIHRTSNFMNMICAAARAGTASSSPGAASWCSA